MQITAVHHVWTFIFKSFHPLAPLELLPNILKAISQQELKHFKSVEGGKFNFTFHTISSAILSKYSYYEHVMRPEVHGYAVQTIIQIVFCSVSYKQR